MKCKAIVLTTTGQQVATGPCKEVIMQSPTGNATVYFGTSEQQLMTIAAGGTAVITTSNADHLYVRGTATEVLNVLINK